MCDDGLPSLHERLQDLAGRPELATPLSDAFFDCAGEAKHLEGEVERLRAALHERDTATSEGGSTYCRRCDTLSPPGEPVDHDEECLLHGYDPEGEGS